MRKMEEIDKQATIVADAKEAWQKIALTTEAPAWAKADFAFAKWVAAAAAAAPWASPASIVAGIYEEAKDICEDAKTTPTRANWATAERR